MKKIILSASLVAVFAITNFAQSTLGNGPEIQFNKEFHDFGDKDRYSSVRTVFKVTNTGSEPLIINEAEGSCGCTTPFYPKQPIPPGATEEIIVRYDSARVGPFNKTVTVTSNAVNEPKSVLKIKGNMLAANE